MRRLAVVVGIVGALGVWLVQDRTTELEPGGPAWRRLVGGATPSGRVPARAVVTLPGFRRGAAGQARIELDGRSAVVRVGVDRAEPFAVRADRDGVALVSVPRGATPGTRLYLSPEAGGEPLTVRRIVLTSAAPPYWPVAVAFAFTCAVGLISGSVALSLAAASFSMLVAVSSLLWVSVPSVEALLRLAPIFLIFGASVAVGTRDRRYWAATSLVAALVFGTWVRFYFVASAGSWDTEYWKAWMTRAVSHGVTGVYGDADATPEGEFFSHLLGRSDLFQPRYKGRSFVVDYPPLAMALWRGSWKTVDFLLRDFDPAEKENIAVKLPAVVGDVAALIVLLLVLPGRPAVAIAYWAAPVSWLPSAVLGFFDATYAPLAVLALIAAGRGRAGWSGALIALAALIKPQALILAPAALVALGPYRARVVSAVGAGLAVVAVSLVPFVAAGTLDEAVTHVFRIIFQERLSAGFANPWWVVGHLVNGGAVTEPVQYARIDALSFPVGILGVALFAGLLFRFCRRWGRDPCLAAGGILFAYGLFAMGVHENHPHAMFLAFAASGLASRRILALVAVLSTSYVLNMLSLSVIGRFYGLRYLSVEGLASALSGLRMGLGFDLTLLLAGVNTVVMAFLLFEATKATGTTHRLAAP